MRIALTRALVSVFWMATALYALLSAIPFASKQFLEPQLVPAVTAFAAWYPWLSIATLAIAAAGLAPWLRARDRSVCAFAGSWGLVNLLAFVTGGLEALEPSPLSIVVSLLALLPPVWLALLDLREPGTKAAPSPVDAGPAADFVACVCAALMVSGTHALLGVLVTGVPTGWIAELSSAAVLHLLVSSAIFAVISIVRGISRLAPQPEAAEGWLARAVIAAAFCVFMQRVVLSSLSFTGWTAVVVAAAFGVAIALVLGPRGTRAPGGLDEAFAGVVPHWAAGSIPVAALWMLMAMIAVAGLEDSIAGSDWNFTIGKLIALASWLLALAASLRVVPGRLISIPMPRTARTYAPFAACLFVLGLHQFTAPVAAVHDGATPTWTGRDVSSRLIVDALTPVAPASSGLYEYLQSNTNIPRSVHVEPVSVAFAPLREASGRQPHVFIFVIDSLRRDYVSPYNAAASFTPSIGRFASESTVFERAFTRYGGTGLSVPSIWVGGLLLHKQYVTPFAPMNTLAKLLAVEGYAQWVSMEHIIETILPPSEALAPLDVNVAVKDQRLCRTLQEVRQRLDRLTPSGPPAFVYTLPQDVHVSTITREGAEPVDAGDYTGFNAAYASRVRRMDVCFGEFIADLKVRGLYDDSIIIVTSDHGDSLGEEGRMGHAYTIFPEVLQVPLLVHLPARLRGSFSAQHAAVAFTSDITPSLYALLGHPPVRPSKIFGQSLFHTASTAPASRETGEMVASSYGSVYGALLDDARRLYIIDAISLREHVYEIDGSAGGRPVAVRQGDREAGQRAVRAAIDEISRFYAYRAASNPN